VTGADVFMCDPEPFQEPDNEPMGCRCESPDGAWKLSIEDGGVTLTHTVCGQGLPHHDLMDTVYMPETEVLLSIESETCRCYHDCDCDMSVVLTLPR
jgi:hypothetical protein